MVCKARTTDGSATLRIVLSRLISSKVTQRTDKVAQRLRPPTLAAPDALELPLNVATASPPALSRCSPLQRRTTSRDIGWHGPKMARSPPRPEQHALSRASPPTHLLSWRNRMPEAVATAVGVPWAMRCAGRCTCRTLRISAGSSPVMASARAGRIPEAIWRHDARAFDRSRTITPVPRETALRAARGQIARSGVPKVRQDPDAAQVEDLRLNARGPANHGVCHSTRGRNRACAPWLPRCLASGSAGSPARSVAVSWSADRPAVGPDVTDWWAHRGQPVSGASALWSAHRLGRGDRRSTIHEMTPNTTKHTKVIRETTQMTSNRVARHPLEFWISASTQSPITATVSSIHVRRLKNMSRR